MCALLTSSNAVFFRGLQWDKLLNKETRPPYIPKVVRSQCWLFAHSFHRLQSGNFDVSFFDSDFTTAKTTLTPPPKRMSCGHNSV
jgi:hypothetical protein